MFFFSNKISCNKIIKLKELVFMRQSVKFKIIVFYISITLKAKEMTCKYFKDHYKFLSVI